MAFSNQIREGTMSSHRSVEASAFVVRFIRGKIELDEYRRLHAAMYIVYVAMEEELTRHRDHPLLKSLYFPALFRRESLQDDLGFLYGASWADHIDPSPAQAAYVDRIRWVGDNEPELLVAHHYTRYLGDLSGGLILGRMARKALDFKGNQGLRFYMFEDISDSSAFKTMYRQCMDALPLTDSQRHAIIDEANRVFMLNQGLFHELD